MLKSKIIGIGGYLPKKIYDNKYMESLVETSDEWITERTGIKKRHIADINELTSDLAFEASKKAIINANLNVEDIEAIIVATTTPDRTFPSTATILQNKLGIGENCFAFDVQSVCCGFIYALDVADSLIKTSKAKNILVVGADTLSKIVNWDDRTTCVLFGDGAGAVVLQATENQEEGILASSLHSDGKYFDILKTSGGVSFNQQVGFIEMKGKEVFKIAVNKLYSSILEALEKVNLNSSDVDLLIPHQANQRIIEALGKKLNLETEKIVSTVALHGNTSAASVPLALDYAIQNNRIKKDDIVVLEGIGGGMSWGSIVMKW